MTVLIIFIILLTLLTLLGAFGGSIKTETFYEEDGIDSEQMPGMSADMNMDMNTNNTTPSFEIEPTFEVPMDQPIGEDPASGSGSAIEPYENNQNGAGFFN